MAEEEVVEESTQDNNVSNESLQQANNSGAVEEKGSEQSSVAQRPDEIPEELWDSESGKINKEKLDQTLHDAKRTDDMRKKLSLNDVPKDPSGYEFKTASEDTIPEIKEDFAKFAHEIELPKHKADELFGKLSERFTDYVKLATTPSDEDLEKFQKAQKEELGDDYEKIADAVKSYGNTLSSDEEFEDFKATMYDAKTTRAVYKLIQQAQEKSIPKRTGDTHMSDTSEDQIKEEYRNAIQSGDIDRQKKAVQNLRSFYGE